MSTTITQLPTSSKNGDKAALNELLPLVYGEMRKLAKGFLSRERVGHTLQPTALVHEVYLRLAGQSPVEWQNRAHFFGAASRLMREILIDHARSRNRKKRGSELRTFIEIDSKIGGSSDNQLDVLAVDEALNELERLDERQAKIVEMKFFAGMTIEEIAAVLDISSATVKREWTSAKFLLTRMLDK